MDELRSRERRLESVRHSLELSLSESRQQVSELTVGLTGYEGRVAELTASVDRLQAEKRQLEAKLAAVHNMIEQVRQVQRSSLQC